jgi:hypothetical protein
LDGIPGRHPWPASLGGITDPAHPAGGKSMAVLADVLARQAATPPGCRCRFFDL